MKNKPISASRIKTLQECSWKYHCKYQLKLPDQTNDGALRGSCVHIIFECLGNPRHKSIYNTILNNDDAFSHPTIERYVNNYLNQNSMCPEENKTLINEMIVEGIKADFYGSAFGDVSEAHSELDFDLEIKEGDKDYRILGFIDKLFLYKKKSLAVIRDFKTSKKVFVGKEIEDNMQDMIYRLAVKYLYPDFFKRKMQFLFLRFGCEDGQDGNVLTPDISEDDLDGFELFLTEIQKIINNFDDNDAHGNFAFNHGFPSTEEGFTKRLLCGFAKYPGQLKKDGNLMWHCPFKFPFDYYVLLDDTGEIIKTSDSEEELDVLRKHHVGSIVQKKKYEGCPAASSIYDSSI